MLTVSDNHIVLGGGGGGGGGDVVGAASSTDNAIARFDGVTGKVIQDSLVTLNDTGGVKLGLSGQLELSTSVGAGTVYFGNFANPAGGKVGFSVPGTVILALDQATQRIGFGGVGAYYASYAPDSLVEIKGRVTTDKTLSVKAVSGQTATVLEVLDSVGNISITSSSVGNVGIGVEPTDRLDVNGSVRFRGAIKDSTGSTGLDGQVLKNINGLPVWSNP